MNIFLISSPSWMLIKEEIAKIIKTEKNIIYSNFADDGVDFILEEASYLSLFDDKKYLIVKNANIFSSSKCKDGDLEKIEKYLANPNSNTILIFYLTDKVDERKKIVKIIKEKYTYKVLKNLSSNELVSKITNIFKKEGIKIDFNSANYIASSCLNNYDLACKEIEKLITYAGENKIIDYDAVVNLVPKTIEENIFKFSDAVVRRDNKKIFELFNDLKQLKEEPVILINNLAREYRLMYKCYVLNKNGLKLREVATELGLVEWQADKFLKNSYNYRPNEMLDKLNQLADLDIAIKNGSIDKYLGIELFLLD